MADSRSNDASRARNVAGFGDKHVRVWNELKKAGGSTERDAVKAEIGRVLKACKTLNKSDVAKLEMAEKMQVGIVGGRPPFFYETRERLLELYNLLEKRQKLSPQFRLVQMELQSIPGHVATTDTAFDLRVWKPTPPLPLQGKLQPSAYGSLPEYDLGLCKATFTANEVCELGADCPFRHQGLSEDEHWFLACLRNRPAADSLIYAWKNEKPVHEQTRWCTDKN